MNTSLFNYKQFLCIQYRALIRVAHYNNFLALRQELFFTVLFQWYVLKILMRKLHIL
jgi:hypothetical protein